jgi:hypothetical protein
MLTRESGLFREVFARSGNVVVYVKYHNGNRYVYDSWSSGMTDYDDAAGKYVETPGVFRVQFSLTGYPYDTVWLSPAFARSIRPTAPIEIAVK